MSEELIQNSMKIILHAGDARLNCKKSLEAIAAFDFQKAKELLALANDDIRLAHMVQTDEIQQEARGEGEGYSILFAHAQDTLMTVYSEINIAKQLILIFESFDKRIKKIEM